MQAEEDKRLQAQQELEVEEKAAAAAKDAETTKKKSRRKKKASVAADNAGNVFGDDDPADSIFGKY